MKKIVILVIVIVLLLVTSVAALATPYKNGAEFCKGEHPDAFADCMKAPAHLCWNEPWTTVFKNHGQCVKAFMYGPYH